MGLPPMRLWVKGKLQALTRCMHLSRGKVITMCGYVMSMSIGRLTMVGVGGIVDRRLVLMVAGGIVVDEWVVLMVVPQIVVAGRGVVLIVDWWMRGRLEICRVELENLIL